jgi:hypothetical protein
MTRLSLFLVAFLLSFAASSQELIIGAGGVRSGEHASHAYSLGYNHRFYGPLSGGVVYLNEGHLPDHHRDGFGAQLWLESGSPSSRFSLGVGAGPYHYFDTVRVPSAGGGFEDQTGWGALYSAAATWRPSGRWFYQLRFNRVIVRNGFDTSSLIAAVGLRLDPDEGSASGASRPSAQPRNEVLVLGGRTIMNSFGNESATAKAVEYRREFGELLHGSLTLLDEGDTQIARRRGLLVQAWIEPSFQNERLTLGVGGGPYLANDSRAEDSTQLGAALSLTASWRVTDSWVARATFHRVVSSNHRDSDVFLLGLGYRF